MRSAPRDLTGTHYDLLIVGGGIHGLFAAYDAAGRGLSVALVEQGDFGGGLSSDHQRTIHGGLRDVAVGSFGKARRQIAERRRWTRLAPHLLQPLPFLVGTRGRGVRSRWALGAGFAVYDTLGWSRNAGVPPPLRLPAARLETVEATRRLCPGIATTELTGGAVWYDYQVRHPDRLNWTVAQAATRAGAHLANYVEALGPVAQGAPASGVRLRHHATGDESTVQASATLLAAGSGLSGLMDKFGVTGAPPLVRAMNALIDRPAGDCAVAASGRSSRILTAVPWSGLTLVGTYQSEGLVAANEPGPPPGTVAEMLDEVNAAFPGLRASQHDIRLVHHGLVPAVLRRGRAEPLSEPLLVRHRDQGVPGLLSLVGVKFTTARQAAERAVDAVCLDLGRTAGSCLTATSSLPHARVEDRKELENDLSAAAGVDLDGDIAQHLIDWYATEAPALLEFSAARGLLDRLAGDGPVLAGEIAYAVECGDAVRLSDAVLRRTPLGAAGHPGQAPLERAAEVMGELRGWTSEQRRDEIAAVELRYTWPGGRP